MREIYTDGTYLNLNPIWHREDSPWKAVQIMRMLSTHDLQIHSVAEIGCGVGGVIAALYEQMPHNLDFHGFDISPDAIARAKERERLHFYCEDLLSRSDVYDLLLVIDVVEHVPDYLRFLEECRKRARFKLYHIPLDIHLSSVIRASFINGRQSIGHIHYFTAESALASLTDTGHKIIDSFYTDGAVALSKFHPSIKRRLANIPRRLVSFLSLPWAARLLGGYSLLVLAE